MTLQVVKYPIKNDKKSLFPYHLKFYSFSTACMSLVDESARVHRILCQQHRCMPVEDPSEADFIVISTCAISKESALNSINNIRKLGLTYGKKLYIIGCLVNATERKLIEDNILFDIKFISADDILEEVLYYDKSFNIKCINRCKPFWLKNLDKKIIKLNKLKDKKAEKHGFRTDGLIFSYWPKNFETIRLSKGCNKKCSYCAIPNNRGEYIENKFENIKNQIDNTVSNNLLLIGENIGQHSYFHAILTYAIYKNKKLMLRYLEPEYANKLKLIKSINQISYVGIPIQSGSYKVLRKMNRYHNIKYVKETFKWLKKQGIFTGTSILLSHPTEKWYDYLKTVWFIISTPLDFISFQNFSPREGTPDWKYYNWNSNSTKNKIKYKIFDYIVKIKGWF